MNDYSTYWILGVMAVGFVIVVVTGIMNRNLPPKQKRFYAQQSAAIAVALLAFSIPIFKPYIFSYSGVRSAEELKAENLDSIEKVALFEEKQTRQIELLKSEIAELRDDLRNLNRYYGISNQILWNGIAMTAIFFAFRKRKNKDLEEIEPDQVSKL